MPILDINNKDEVTKYKEYINKSKYARLTQALEWADVKNNWKKEIVYLEENGNIIASMMLLIQSMKIGGYNIMYAPRGPVCDIYDINTVNRLIKEAQPLIKKYKACMIKFDPQVSYTDNLNELYLSNGFKISITDYMVQALGDYHDNEAAKESNATAGALNSLIKVANGQIPLNMFHSSRNQDNSEYAKQGLQAFGIDTSKPFTINEKTFHFDSEGKIRLGE